MQATAHERSPAYQRLCDMGREARAHLDTGRWLIGDLAIEVDSAYGENRIKDFANEIGAPVSSVKQYRAMSRFYEKDTRVTFLDLANITYSHMRLAKRLLTRDAARMFLYECADNDWTVERAIVALNARIGKPIPPLKLLDASATVRQIETSSGYAVIVLQCAAGVDVFALEAIDGKAIRFAVWEETE